MTQQEILNGNKLIADSRFSSERLRDQIKIDLSKYGEEYAYGCLRYHKSWGSLMLVVEEIAKYYDVRITWMPSAIDVTYINRPDVSDGEISSMGGLTAIENTFVAVVKFIEWYNTKSPHRKKSSIQSL